MEGPRKVKVEQLRGIPQTTKRWPRNNEKLTRKRQEATIKKINEKREKSLQKLEPGERLPNEWETKALDVTNQILEKEFQRLGLFDTKTGESLYVPVVPKQLRVVSKPELHEAKDVFESGGLGVTHTDGIRMAVFEEEHREKFLDILMHEMLHICSFKTFGPMLPHLIGEKGQDEYRYEWEYAVSRRFGYDLNYTPDKTGEVRLGRRFSALNEALTESMTKRLLHEHAQLLVERIPGLSAEKLSETVSEKRAYVFEMRVLDVLISELAKSTNEGGATVRDKLERGLFTGNMMHLRSIEKTFGENALLFISLMSTEKDSFLIDGKTAREFLTEKDPVKKFELGVTLFTGTPQQGYFIEGAFSRSIKRLLRKPLPEKKDVAYEKELIEVFELIELKLNTVKKHNAILRNTHDFMKQIKTFSARRREYEEKFGPILKKPEKKGRRGSKRPAS